MDEIWNDYFEYLLLRGNLNQFPEYKRLFNILHGIEFECVLERDENRAEDGLDLREDYDIPNSCLLDTFMRQECSVLEMLIALAIRVDNEYIGDPCDEHPEEFFMEMIANLGLNVYEGTRYQKDDVIKIIDVWMGRRFKKNGKGSPFPLRYDCRDQRDIEIGDQVNAYIFENYC